MRAKSEPVPVTARSEARDWALGREVSAVEGQEPARLEAALDWAAWVEDHQEEMERREFEEAETSSQFGIAVGPGSITQRTSRDLVADRFPSSRLTYLA